MTAFILKRLVHALGVLWATFTAAFLLLYVLPGDAALSKLNLGGGSGFSADALEKMRADLGLDQPIWIQYGRALWSALQGNFGVSVQTGQDALQMFATGIPETLKLAALALFLGLALGFGVALLASSTKLAALRGMLLSFPVVGVSMPSFWLGLVLLELFSFRIKLLPAMGNDGFASIILPAAVLAIPSGALVAQILSRSLNGVLASSYIATAKGRGASSTRVLVGHALRNSLIPVMTAIGTMSGQLIAGSVVVETVFSRSGIGLLTVKAVLFQDTPIVLVAVLFAAAVFVTVNFIVDLLYPFVDPRIDVGVRQAKIVGAKA